MVGYLPERYPASDRAIILVSACTCPGSTSRDGPVQLLLMPSVGEFRSRDRTRSRRDIWSPRTNRKDALSR